MARTVLRGAIGCDARTRRAPRHPQWLRRAACHSRLALENGSGISRIERISAKSSRMCLSQAQFRYAGICSVIALVAVDGR